MEYSKNFYQIKSNSEIFKKVKDEREHIGYYSLPYQDVSAIHEYAKGINKQNIVVIGIGGSTLGTRAIYDFLLPANSYDKKLFFLESVDPLTLNHLLGKIDLLNAHFVIISKSGSTIEINSIFKYLSGQTPINSTNCTVISGVKSKLTKFAIQQNIKVFDLPENIGGRFSVFSVVGLVPLAMVGVDIDNLLNGCRRVSDSFFAKNRYYSPILEKARFHVENKSRFNINVVFSYSSTLESFNKWYIQLWAESLGKVNVNNTRQALTPVGLVGPVDQHSFLQLIIDGVRDKTVTFIKVSDHKDSSMVSQDGQNALNSLDGQYANGMSFNDLINKQADATIQSIQEQEDIPCDVLTVTTVDEYNIAKLMFAYQLLVSCIGQFLQINTYDQPGVEYGKISLIESLSSES